MNEKNKIIWLQSLMSDALSQPLFGHTALTVWLTGLSFFSNTSYWITFAAAMVAATLPALLKSLRLLPMLLILFFWLASIISMALTADILPALAGGGISLLWGLLLMLTSLLFSGVRQMAKKRYG